MTNTYFYSDQRRAIRNILPREIKVTHLMILVVLVNLIILQNMCVTIMRVS